MMQQGGNMGSIDRPPRSALAALLAAAAFDRKPAGPTGDMGWRSASSLRRGNRAALVPPAHSLPDVHSRTLENC
ncbi:hypothetical protein CHELA20_10596 [Hyphomicrobiales bacterium]|nr:hypothetical protein CHELA20_10596 [Hyphomicrobiales bacterium]CAH1692908.1 hypothetical protein CHELA41_50825 [Hyphomicrobiales bacterium]